MNAFIPLHYSSLKILEGKIFSAKKCELAQIPATSKFDKFSLVGFTLTISEIEFINF